MSSGFAPGSVARNTFEKNFKRDVAAVLKISVNRVSIVSVLAGSVIVRFNIFPDTGGHVRGGAVPPEAAGIFAHVSGANRAVPVLFGPLGPAVALLAAWIPVSCCKKRMKESSDRGHHLCRPGELGSQAL